MYGIFLMATLSAGGSAPDCWNCRPAAGAYYAGGGHGCVHCGPVAHGYSHGGGIGCYGGTYGANWVGVTSNYECWGGHGCYGCTGYMGCGGYGATVPVPTPEVIPTPRVDTTVGQRAPVPARLTVEVPRDAKLFIDDQLMKTTAEKRTFKTPELRRGEVYYYEVRAEVVRDGKAVTETKKVFVRAGEEKVVAFKELAAPATVVAEVTRR